MTGPWRRRRRREPVAAGLVAREALALENAHVGAGLGQPDPRRAARRTTPDDENVVSVDGHRIMDVLTAELGLGHTGLGREGTQAGLRAPRRLGVGEGRLAPGDCE